MLGFYRIPILRNAGLFLGIYTIAAVLCFVTMPLGVDQYDEGIVLEGAWRVYQGGVPYRDFWTSYGPAQYYLTAACFPLLGPTILAGRLCDALLVALLCPLCFFITRGSAVGVHSRAPFAALIALISIVLCRTPGYPATGAFVGVLAGLLLRETSVVAGVLVGVTAAFRPDFSCVLGFALLAARLLDVYLTKVEGRRYILWLLTAALCSVAVVYGPLLAVVPQKLAVEQLLLYGLTYFSPYRELSWGYLADHDSYSFLIVGTACILGLVSLVVWGWKCRKDRSGLQYNHLALAVLAFLPYTIIRKSASHSLPELILATVLLLLLRKEWSARFLGSLNFLLVLGFLLLVPAHPLSRIEGRFRCGPKQQSCGYLDGSLQQVVAFLRTHTNASSHLYSGLSQHQRFRGNNILLYFLTGMEPAIRRQELTPDLAFREDAQRELVSDLIATRPAYLVLAQHRKSDEPNLSGVESGVHLLDEYIAANYAIVRSFPPYDILAARGTIRSRHPQGVSAKDPMIPPIHNPESYR